MQPIPHHALFSKRTLLEPQRESLTAHLCEVFADAISNHEEGLVLKASNSRYNDTSLPWVKVKRDYIPGLGDCLDMVILGADWEKDRGRGLYGNFPTLGWCLLFVNSGSSPNRYSHYLLRRHPGKLV